MAIKYLQHTITEMKHPETGDEMYELAHWEYSSEFPYVAARRHIGLYGSYEDAEGAHAKEFILTRFS